MEGIFSADYSPTAVSHGAGKLVVIGLSRNGEAFSKGCDAFGCDQDWFRLGGDAFSDIRAVSRASNTIDVFGLDLNGAVHHLVWDGGQAQTAWANLDESSQPSSTSASPSASTTSSPSSSSSGSSSATPGRPPSNNGLSTGAKVGIGVGVPLGVLALVDLLGGLYWRKRKQAQAGEDSYFPHVAQPSTDPDASYISPVSELPSPPVDEVYVKAVPKYTPRAEMA